MLILAALIATSIAHPPTPGSFNKPAWAEFAFPVAVDHEAVMLANRGWGPPGEDRVTIIRKGDWLREAKLELGSRSTAISNLKDGSSLDFSVEPGGRYFALTISGRSEATATTVERTSTIDHALGETCRVWLLRWKEIVDRDCVTADGILLWQRVESGGSGAVLSSGRAISIRRRPVTVEEVAPPPGLLALSSWRAWGEPSTAARSSDVRLEGQRGQFVSRPSRDMLMVRSLGKYWLYASVSGLGEGRQYVGDGVVINASLDAGQRVRRLDMTRPAHMPNRPVGSGSLNPARREMTPEGQCEELRPLVRTFDFGEQPCYSTDGVLLRLTRTVIATSTTFVSSYLRRGGLSLDDVAPPDDLLLSAWRGQPLAPLPWK